MTDSQPSRMTDSQPSRMTDSQPSRMTDSPPLTDDGSPALFVGRRILGAPYAVQPVGSPRLVAGGRRARGGRAGVRRQVGSRLVLLGGEPDDGAAGLGPPGHHLV